VDKARELELQCMIPNWDTKSITRPVVDIFTVRFKKFQTSLLATFNKKIGEIKEGKARYLEPEADEITPCQVVQEDLDAPDEDNSDSLEEISTLHDSDD
jgi:hypothetical protein